MTRPEVSVVLCTRNGARHLPEMLESLRSQRRPPDEVVVRDDASTDETPSLLEEFASGSAVPVRVERNERRLGPSRNFGRAIREAEGDVLFLADQDDRWHPAKIERLLGRFSERPGLGYTFSDAALLDAGGEPSGESFWAAAGLEDDLPERFNRNEGVVQLGCLLERNLSPGAALAFRAELREWTLPIPGTWPHDWWIPAVAAGGGRPGEAVPARLLGYREHPGQATGLRRPDRPGSLPARYRRHRRRLRSQVERHERRLARLENLRERLLDRLGPERWRDDRRRRLEAEIEAEREHVRHVHARDRVRGGPLPEAVRQLWRELRGGRYRRHSGSLVSAIADLWDRVGGRDGTPEV